MKKVKNLYLIALATFLILSSCKPQPKLTYKYTSEEYKVACANEDTALLKEALFSFENDLKKYYNQTNGDLYRSYRSFVNEAIYNRAQIKDIISQHTADVFNVLKTKSNLWNGKELNYESALVKCIGENISNKNLKATFNALISTNSMNTKLFGMPLRSQVRSLTNDKHLATFVALDLFYSKLFDLDFAAVMKERQEKEAAKKAEEEAAKNAPAPTENKDPHSGHNHKEGEKHF